MWIFAYGSLIFRPGFAYLERRRAFVGGFVRRLYQGSPDHRGVPGAPGRVATILPEAGAWCGGAAYRVDPAEAGAILAYLDHREQAGFARAALALHDAPSAAPFAEGTTWLAGADNPHFLGPLPEEAIAAEVCARRGPSGENADYVLGLADALSALGIDDAHVAAVARLLRS